MSLTHCPVLVLILKLFAYDNLLTVYLCTATYGIVFVY